MRNTNDPIVMITGATGNLGRAVAERFREGGARLALVGRQTARLAEIWPEWADDPDVGFISVADLTDPDAVAAGVATILSHYGRLDILVHTAGAFRAGTPLYETPLDQLDLMLNANARTTFVTNSAVVPAMLVQGSGRIINVAARPGLQGAAGMGAYSASKAAVIRLTESLAADVKKQGVNVNCILPGTIDTPENRAAMPKANADRWVAPASLAEVIFFLASPAARDIHGAAIPVYGLS